jgi:hypothetical protein
MKTEHELAAVDAKELLAVEGGDTKILSQGTQEALDHLAAAVAKFVATMKTIQ